MIKKYDIEMTDTDTRYKIVEDADGNYCKAEDLQKLWDYCDKEQRYLIGIDGKIEANDFCRGMVTAFRKIQYEINSKCSEFKNEKK